MQRILFYLLLLGAAAQCRAGSIWIEGEDASEKDVTKHGWYDNVKKEGMSGKEWLSHYDANKAGTATYKFDAAEAGEFTFWWRGNTFSKVSYALNGAEAVEISMADKRGDYMISEKPDHRFLAWIKVGKVAIKQGANTITFKIHGDIANSGGMDCFLFDNTGFIPTGENKPGSAGTAEKVAGPDQAIWIEGEDATMKDVTKHGWYDAVHKDGLSGKEWLSHYDAAKPGTATYKFDVVKPDDYVFWWRGNTFSKVSYQLNKAEAVEIEFADKRGEFMLSDKPDHRFLAWVKVGTVKLPKGENTITFKIHGDIANSGGIDCFCFSRVPFVPSGVNKPSTTGEVKGGPGDWFPVVFDNDAFSEKSITDMSRYIAAPAGQLGFLKRSGAHLKFQTAAEPIQFWGCGANMMGETLSKEQLSQRAKYLRKNGVNMIRQHPVQEEIGLLIDGQFDAKRIDKFDWWFAELKKNGIYMTWSVFYGQKISKADGYDPELFKELDVVDKQNDIRSSYGLVNVEPKLQDLQLVYLKAFLAHKNAYTGLRYADDPELAVMEFQNEDCVFFYNPLGGLRDGKNWPLHAKRLRQHFFTWAQKKYGTEADLKQAWGSLRAGDSFANGELEVMGAHHLGEDGPTYEYSGQVKRAGDFIHFLTDMQRTFYDRREKELREIGFKAVTVTSAWRSGGPAADPANLYCDTAADMIDRHNYFGGGAGGHGISEGKVNNETHLTQPGSGLLSIGLYQVEDRPFCCTEWTQCPPNQWKVEAAPLMAFYGMGLQGWDSSYHFTNSRVYPGDGWPGLSAYMTDTPHYIAQFPALFFSIHNHHIQEAPIAAARRLKVDELFSGVDPIKQDFTGGGHDVKSVKGELKTPVEALAIGRVTINFEGGKNESVDFSKYWDASQKVVKSMTGELTWDYGHQFVTVQSAKTQGVIGRAVGQTIELPGVSAKITTPFVSLLFTPLDDKPLADSAHILITAMARDSQTNAQYSADGTKLIQIGGPPLLMEPVQAMIKLKGAVPTAVNVVDIYGVPTARPVKLAADGSFAISGEYKTYYYEVKR